MLQGTGIQGDNWKGKYTGTMNTAFKLGLPVGSGLFSSSSSSYPIGSGTLGREPSYIRPTYNDNDYYGTATTRRYPAYDRDNYGNGGYNTGIGYGDSGLGLGAGVGGVGGRDSSYYGNRDRDNTAYPVGGGRYPASSISNDRNHYGSSPRVTENQVMSLSSCWYWYRFLLFATGYSIPLHILLLTIIQDISVT